MGLRMHWTSTLSIVTGFEVCVLRVFFHPTVLDGELKGTWARFQARAPPISFLTIEGRAAANPPPSI